ncbi:unnamed protein product, partial [Chrysoparadoxa australica]
MVRQHGEDAGKSPAGVCKSLGQTSLNVKGCSTVLEVLAARSGTVVPGPAAEKAMGQLRHLGTGLKSQLLKLIDAKPAPESSSDATTSSTPEDTPEQAHITWEQLEQALRKEGLDDAACKSMKDFTYMNFGEHSCDLTIEVIVKLVAKYQALGAQRLIAE